MKTSGEKKTIFRNNSSIESKNDLNTCKRRKKYRLILITVVVLYLEANKIKTSKERAFYEK